MIAKRMIPCPSRFLERLFRVLAALPLLCTAAVVQETPHELIAPANLNNDGLPDILLVDKPTGRVRTGFGLTNGLFHWVEWRDSGVRGVTGMSPGRLFSGENDGLVVASRDGNQLALVDLSDPTTARVPVDIPFMLLGPECAVALTIPGEGLSPLHDLFVGSVYNAPEPNVASLFRNTGGSMEPLGEWPLTGTPARANRIRLKAGGAEFLAMILQEAGSTALRVQSLATGRPVDVLSAPAPGPDAHYTLARLRPQPQADLLIWTPGSHLLSHHPVLEPSPEAYEIGAGRELDLGAPIRSVIPLSEEATARLLVIQGSGEAARLYEVRADGTIQAGQSFPAPAQHLFTGALPVPEGFIAFQGYTNGGSAVRYQIYRESGGAFAEGIYGRLPTLADNDKLTIPELHSRIVARTGQATEEPMQAYTNVIPGTRVEYVMVPIPAGRFPMGSPGDEPGRQPDEGPLHDVRVAPFWMGEFEVTWQQFELFMYPDAEKKMREIHPTDPAGDALADALTRPSKPYADMTFGMGREGYPAIGMTQHGANKYCQWLSAKTGHFYRLPTEAEWEYAARAGTTTAYFFGNDAAALDSYAWYEMNSEFKYQKIGRKKPNPWGLHDIYGNVAEWVLDQYDPDYYAACAARGVVENPWNKATRPYPHSVRGGSWDDPAEACRSAARRGSEPVWKLQDPQLPKSIWYFTDADFVGFRLVRPLQVPNPEEMQAYWYSGVERE